MVVVLLLLLLPLVRMDLVGMGLDQGVGLILYVVVGTLSLETRLA
jgi:hypothetical protein